jgi:hypothetical protein
MIARSEELFRDEPNGVIYDDCAQSRNTEYSRDDRQNGPGFVNALISTCKKRNLRKRANAAKEGTA